MDRGEVEVLEDTLQEDLLYALYVRDAMLHYASAAASGASDPSKPLDRLLSQHFPEKDVIKLQQIKKAMEGFWPLQNVSFGIRSTIDRDRMAKKRKRRVSIEVMRDEHAEAGKG